MKSFFDILKPAPSIKAIEDEEIVKKEYRYWQFRIFISIYIGYAFFYFSRKSFVFAMPGLIQDLGFTKESLGLMGTVLAISYGVSKFVNGIFGDKSNARYFMAIG